MEFSKDTNLELDQVSWARCTIEAEPVNKLPHAGTPAWSQAQVGARHAAALKL